MQDMDLGSFFDTMSSRANKDSIHTAIVGELVSYDAQTRRAFVQPAVRQKDDRGVMQYPVLEDVKVVFPGGGGYGITWEPKKGDTGMLIFSERSIAEWIKDGGIVTAKSERHHALSDAIFIPGVWPDSNTPHTHEGDGISISNDAGTKRIDLKSDGVHVLGDLNVDGGIEATGDVIAGGTIPGTKISLNSHTHLSAVPGSSSSTPNPMVP